MIAPRKDAAQRELGEGVNSHAHLDYITAQAKLIAAVVPGGGPHVAEYVIVAALLHRPSWAAPHLRRLHPANFTRSLHRIMTRCAMSGIHNYGLADLRTICRLLDESGDFRSESVEIELRTLQRVADLIAREELVRRAVDQMVADRQHRQDRGDE